MNLNDLSELHELDKTNEFCDILHSRYLHLGSILSVTYYYVHVIITHSLRTHFILSWQGFREYFSYDRAYLRV